MFKRSRILYNQITDSNNGGGGNNVPPPPTPNAPPPQAQGTPQFDAFGYAVPAAPPTPPAPNQTPQGTQPPPTPPQPDLNTGYNAFPLPSNVAGYVDPATIPPPPTPPPPAAPPAVELVDMKDLSDTDKKLWGDYFTEHKLPKEAQTKLIEIEKNRVLANQQAEATRQKQIEAETTRLKSQWFNELKTDKEFGAAFDVNVKMVNRLISDFMPNTKKMLTEKGGMLPPNTMRDFYALAKKLYETESFVQGSGPGASGQVPNAKWGFLSDMYVNNK